MRCIQVDLDDDLWSTLQTQARQHGRTVPELVRMAARERYLGNFEERRRAMEAFIGIRKSDTGLPDSVEEVGRLRKGARLERL